MMDRKGFLGALLGVPFVAGWVSKLDSSGKRTVEVIEPVASIPFVQTEITYADSVVTTTAGVGTSTIYYTPDQMGQMHRDGSLSYTF